MRVLQNGAFSLLMLAFGVSGFAQSTPASEATAAAPGVSASAAAPLDSGGKNIHRKHQGSCWKMAGIAPQQMNLRWKINDHAQVRISGVCSDPKLSAEQKQAKIHEIDEDRDRQIADLIPAKELESYQSCEAQRVEPVKAGERKLGPCGGVLPSTPASGNSHESHEHHAAGTTPTH